MDLIAAIEDLQERVAALERLSASTADRAEQAASAMARTPVIDQLKQSAESADAVSRSMSSCRDAAAEQAAAAMSKVRVSSALSDLQSLRPRLPVWARSEFRTGLLVGIALSATLCAAALALGAP